MATKTPGTRAADHGRPAAPARSSRRRSCSRRRWRTGSVRRPRLTGLLRARRPALTLIVAPPGFGKTSLLADWAGIDGRSFAWVTVEPEDNDQAVLWSSIGAALGNALGDDGRARRPARRLRP